MPTKKKSALRKQFQVKLTTEEKRLFSEAAEREHLTISAWLRVAGLARAKEGR